jgi:hypothetical protein
MKQLLTFAENFRMDNPLTKQGSDVYQPSQPVNLTYDAFGPAAAFVRGLFEYLYRADGLELIPHIPDAISELDQRFPIRFGRKLIFLTTLGRGPVRRVEVNGAVWSGHDAKSVFLNYAEIPDAADIRILLGDAKGRAQSRRLVPHPRSFSTNVSFPDLSPLEKRAAVLRKFVQRLNGASSDVTYEKAHAQLALDAMEAAHARRALLASDQLTELPERSRAAANQLYLDSAMKLFDGLEKVIAGYQSSDSPERRKIYDAWRRSNKD